MLDFFLLTVLGMLELWWCGFDLWTFEKKKKNRLTHAYECELTGKFKYWGVTLKSLFFFLSPFHQTSPSQQAYYLPSPPLHLIRLYLSCWWPATHQPLAGSHSSRRWAVGHCSSRPTINASHHNRPVATSNAQVFLGCFGLHVDVNPNTVPCGLFPPSVHNMGATWLGLD